MKDIFASPIMHFWEEDISKCSGNNYVKLQYWCVASAQLMVNPLW